MHFGRNDSPKTDEFEDTRPKSNIMKTCLM